MKDTPANIEEKLAIEASIEEAKRDYMKIVGRVQETDPIMHAKIEQFLQDGFHQTKIYIPLFLFDKT